MMPVSFALLFGLFLFQAVAPAPQTPVTTGPDRQAPAPAAPQALPEPADPVQALERRADLHMARKEYRDAVNTYLKALSLDPRSHILCNKVGIAYHQQMAFNDAKRYYERAIKLNKKYGEALNNLGTIYYARRKHGTAIKWYRRALEVNPNSASIYSNLGTAHFARKKYDDAFEAYRKALELDPEVFEHRSGYGVLLQERSVQDRARFHYFLAKTYAAAGLFDRALLYLKKALEDGFKEKEKISDDPSFAELVKTDGFIQLMANPPTPLPH